MRAVPDSLDSRLRRFACALVVLLVAPVVVPAIAPANPLPPNVWVVPCDALNGVVLCPDTPEPIPSSVVQITYHNEANQPVPDAAVNISFEQGPLCMCASMVYNAVTDENGQAVLTIRGGGCIHNLDAAAMIRVNGMIVRNYRNLKSPDWDGASGDCLAGLPDLVRFIGHDICFDFDNDHDVDVSDLVIFSSGFSPAHGCAR